MGPPTNQIYSSPPSGIASQAKEMPVYIMMFLFLRVFLSPVRGVQLAVGRIQCAREKLYEPRSFKVTAGLRLFRKQKRHIHEMFDGPRREPLSRRVLATSRSGSKTLSLHTILKLEAQHQPFDDLTPHRAHCRKDDLSNFLIDDVLLLNEFPHQLRDRSAYHLERR